MSKLEEMQYGFKDIAGTVWPNDWVDHWNRKAKTYNYALENQGEAMAIKARQSVSDVYHNYCKASCYVGG